MSHPTYLVATFYKFVVLDDLAQRKAYISQLCINHSIKGLVILADEGINSTIAGTPKDVHAVLSSLRADPLLSDLQHKESHADKSPFYRMKVRIKKEIVTMGVANLNPQHQAGRYVNAREWNALICQPDVILIDTRNDYEVQLGTFKGAINPRIHSFAQLPHWLASTEKLQAVAGKKPKVAMFCTGGIRCEKSTAWIRAQNYDEVYHLKGGVLEYLETVPPEESRWEGQCFVFDERVSVGHGLQPGEHQLCRACRHPLAQGATQSLLYEAGVSCPLCHASSNATQKRGARERQRQWELSKARKQQHIGTH